MLSIFFLLWQDSSNAHVAGICVQQEGTSGIGGSQDRSLSEGCWVYWKLLHKSRRSLMVESCWSDSEVDWWWWQSSGWNSDRRKPSPGSFAAAWGWQGLTSPVQQSLLLDWWLCPYHTNHMDKSPFWWWRWDGDSPHKKRQAAILFPHQDNCSCLQAVGGLNHPSRTHLMDHFLLCLSLRKGQW